MNPEVSRSAKIMVLVEDAESGFQFYQNLVGMERCISAGGNAKVYSKLVEASGTEKVLVVADGAAFGPYIDKVVKYAELKGNVGLYFPESFEWMILRSGILEDHGIADILNEPYSFIDSTEHVSWERFFTALLMEVTKGDSVRRYSKSKLSDYYMGKKSTDRIVNVMPEEIRDLL